MKALLDTHVFLWWITNDQKLSLRARKIIADGHNELYFSAASGWEIAIKSGIGRLELPDEARIFVAEQLKINAISTLPIEMNHALYVSTLPNHHQDPFDRLLVSQARLEGFPILTADPIFKKYKVDVIW